jgi:hypothetical protein
MPRFRFSPARPAVSPAVIYLPDASAQSAQRRVRANRGKDSQRVSWRKRLAVLLAVITVPAMAAPGEFSVFGNKEAQMAAPDPLEIAAANALSFERPGMSFPGSAFYFLDDPTDNALIALPTADPLDSGAEEGRQLGALIDTGPAARPFFTAGTGISHSRALDCLAQAIWYEAASESEAGQRAVAQVVLNRVAHPNWPASVCGVVYQGSQRSTGCQFTFTCDGSLARRAGGATWTKARQIASEALSGKVYSPVGHATHYHTLWVNPYWASSLDHIGTIGAHRFYRNRGAGGEKSAFRMAYAGFEPSVSGRTTPSPDEFSGGPSFASGGFTAGAGRSGENGSVNATPARPESARAFNPAANSTPEYAGSGQVRPEFSNAGQWKVDPAKAMTGARPAVTTAD